MIDYNKILCNRIKQVQPSGIRKYMAAGMDKKQAMKEVARDRGISKRDVYQQLL